MERVLLVKRKGYNEYHTYTEYYLHNALQQFGYHLTRDEATADFVITAYINLQTEYMLFTSPFFQQLHEEDLLAYTQAIAVAMKSEAMFSPHPGKMDTNGMPIFHFLFSRTSNAFAEPALIETGQSILEVTGRNASLFPKGALGITVTNYGGPSQGIDVIIEAPPLINASLDIERAQIRRYTKKGMITEKLVFKKEQKQHICRLDDFEIHSGLNKHSALWCRSRTKYQDTAFYMDFSIANSIPMLSAATLTIKPHQGEGFSIDLGTLFSDLTGFPR